MALLPYPIIFKKLFKRQKQRLLYSITCIKRSKLSFYLVMFKKKKRQTKTNFHTQICLHSWKTEYTYIPSSEQGTIRLSHVHVVVIILELEMKTKRKKTQSAEWCPDNIQCKSTHFPLITNTCHSNRLSYMALNICTLG